MASIYVSVGSNVLRDKHISSGILALKAHFAPIQCSPVYESIAVGFEGENFYNLVVYFSTDKSIDTVSQLLTQIEDDNGRDRSGPKFSSRTLDLDLLLYDQRIINSEKLTLPRPEIYHNAFVLLPLANLAGDVIDPVKNLSYQALWNAFDQSKQKLWQVDFHL